MHGTPLLQLKCASLVYDDVCCKQVYTGERYWEREVSVKRRTLG
jgi:hypothetical protein